MHDELTLIASHNDDALHRNSDVPGSMSTQNVKQAAVLVPLVHHDNHWQILFIRRANNERDRHSGQVAFPGGRVEESDADHEAAALRETREEIGLHPENINIVGQIEPYITISDYQVTPVIGVVRWPTTLNLQISEVARAFLIPLDWLRNRQNLTYRARKDIDAKSAQRHPVIVFNEFDGEVLWGATARITLNFIKAVEDGKIPLPASAKPSD